MTDIQPTGDPSADVAANQTTMDELFLALPAEASLAIEMTQLTQLYPGAESGSAAIPADVLTSYLLKAISVLDIEVVRLRKRVEELEGA